MPLFVICNKLIPLLNLLKLRWAGIAKLLSRKPKSREKHRNYESELWHHGIRFTFHVGCSVFATMLKRMLEFSASFSIFITKVACLLF